jgi:hypothetical protein
MSSPTEWFQEGVFLVEPAGEARWRFTNGVSGISFYRYGTRSEMEQAARRDAAAFSGTPDASADARKQAGQRRFMHTAGRGRPKKTGERPGTDLEDTGEGEDQDMLKVLLGGTRP